MVCSDNRVPANTITGLEPGEVFVHRNVANLLHPTDLNLLSVLEYAIETLDVSHVIVCGHYGCGGIQAALDGQRHGIVDHWLQPIRDVAELNERELGQVADKPSRLNMLCEMSVRTQVTRLARTPIVQSAWKRGKRVRIHGWVYGLEAAELPPPARMVLTPSTAAHHSSHRCAVRFRHSSRTPGRDCSA
ncbi:carbonic anhydrase, partial [Rhizobiaceae sp. 2RAB30]